MLENKDYYVKNQKVKVKVFDLELEFIEKVAIDKNTEEEIYVREIEIENDIRLYDIYKKEKGLLQSSEIKKIREKYGLNQKEFSRILGLGDITIHRYENGTIQTIANDSLIRFVQNPENMEQVALINQKKINEKVFTKLMKKIKTLKLYARHRIADFNINKLHQLEFNTEYVIDIAERVITVYNEEIAQKIDKYNITLPKITNLELQKFLYYIQALSLITFDKPAYKENILAWDYGPVVYEVYCKYRNYKNNEIDVCTDQKLSSGLEEIINIVISSYGKFTGSQLISLTHEEEPWLQTKRNTVIEMDLIKDYFERVYEIRVN